MAENQDFVTLMKKYRKRLGWNQNALANRSGVHRNTISKIETREKLPTKSEVLQFAKDFQLEGEERKEFLIAGGLKGNESAGPLWRVPHQRNTYFLGREKVLERLRHKLVPGAKTTALTQSISGLGGIGKTQVAVEYAHLYGEYYEAVLWIPADSLGTATAAWLQIATELLGLPEQQKAEDRFWQNSNSILAERHVSVMLTLSRILTEEHWLMNCPHCTATTTRKRTKKTKLGYATFFCPQCQSPFHERTGTLFHYREVPTDIVLLVVLWRLRYTLSLRDAADMF